MPSIALPVSLRGQLLSGSRFNPISLFSAGEQGIWLDPSDVANLDWRRNLLTYTEQFDNAVWYKDGATVTTNTTTAPDSMMTADGIVATNRLLWFDNTGFKGLKTQSIYAKANLGSTLAITAIGGQSVVGGYSVIVNLTTGLVTSGQVSPNVIVTDTGNGWWRISILTYVDIASGNSTYWMIGPTSGIYIWGAQLELGSVATEYQRISDVNTEVVERFPRTTMFQDRAGTTPVTTPGQTVGKRLDKSGRGNHAVAPTDAARPTYGIEPKTGRRNLLTQTEDIFNAAWVKTSGMVPTSGATDPDGGNTATTLTATSADVFLYQAASAGAFGRAVVPSLWVRRRTGSGAIRLRNGNTDTAITVTSSWTRVAPAYTSVGLNDWVLNIAVSGDAIDIWHPQLELGSTATNYQKVTTAYDVTESGVATCHYVQYDGSDDSMSTAAIDFTGTDKMSVFAGVVKSSNALTGMLLEISSSLAVGSLNLVVPQVTATGAMRTNSRGTVSAFVDGPAQAAPASFLATIQTDIANDNLLLRLDGTQVAQATTDQGTGNYGNYPLFIGRRNNATLPFNGRDYGIIIVGKTASAGEITDTETWLAARTAQVTL